MNWLRRFMMGRYGNDQLNVALMIFSLLILILGQVLRFSPLVWVAVILLVLCYARMFSPKYQPPVWGKHEIHEVLESHSQLVPGDSGEGQGQNPPLL